MGLDLSITISQKNVEQGRGGSEIRMRTCNLEMVVIRLLVSPKSGPKISPQSRVHVLHLPLGRMVSISRLLSRTLFSTLRHRPLSAATLITRGIINGASMDDILLHQWDLPPTDPDYLMVIEEKFIEKYGDGMLFKVPPPEPNAKRKIRRLAVVLPLKLAPSGKVIPIPYIVDTGAPGIVYFGTKTVTILNSMNLIKNVHYYEFHYLVSGVITCGKKEITQVFASEVPPVYESTEIRDDVRCNLLGLQAILTLGVLNLGVAVGN